jgi:MSHA pilin protein MshA
MQNVQKGFTLIELVVVIVLLGILGVTALAKFQDLSGDAQTAANAGVAAELSSGGSINYAANQLGTTGAATIDSTTTGASAAAGVMSVVPSGYTFTLGTTCGASGAGGTNYYTVADSEGVGSSATAIVICTN